MDNGFKRKRCDAFRERSCWLLRGKLERMRGDSFRGYWRNPYERWQRFGQEPMASEKDSVRKRLGPTKSARLLCDRSRFRPIHLISKWSVFWQSSGIPQILAKRENLIIIISKYNKILDFIISCCMYYTLYFTALNKIEYNKKYLSVMLDN